MLMRSEMLAYAFCVTKKSQKSVFTNTKSDRQWRIVQFVHVLLVRVVISSAKDLLNLFSLGKQETASATHIPDTY